MGKPALVVIKNEVFKPLEKWETLLADRDYCETSHLLLQIIPYIILKDVRTNTYFLYERGVGGGENRLHSKKSIGIGGHIDSLPLKCTLTELIASEAVREIKEEVGLNVNPQQVIDIINNKNYTDIYLPDSVNPVDWVHFGIAFIVEVDKNLVDSKEPNIITKCSWVDKHDLESICNNKIPNTELENWSVVAFKKLIKKSTFA